MGSETQHAHASDESGMYHGAGASLYERVEYDPERLEREARYVAERALAVGEPCRLLDVGCGTGSMDLALATLGLEVVGVDVSDEMLDLARQRVSQVTFLCGDAAHLDRLGLTEPFQVVFGSGGLVHYLEDPADLDAFFVGAEQLLAPDGELILEIADFSLIPETSPTFEREGIVVQQCWRPIGRDGSVVVVNAIRDTNTGEDLVDAHPIFNTDVDGLVASAGRAGLKLVERHPFLRQPSDRSARPSLLALVFCRTS